MTILMINPFSKICASLFLIRAGMYDSEMRNHLYQVIEFFNVNHVFYIIICAF